MSAPTEVAQKLTLEKKWSPKLIFTNENENENKIDFECMYNFGTFCQTVIHLQNFFNFFL